MSASSMRFHLRTISNFGIVTRVAIFLGILLVSGLIIPINYMASNVVFFVALLAFIVFGFKNFQGRNLLLLLYAHLLVFVSTTNVAVVMPVIRQFAANSFPLEPEGGAVLIAMLIALVVTFLVVTIPFLLIVALLSVVVLNWHKGEGATFPQVFDYVLRSILGLPTFWVVIEGGDKKGAEDDIKRLDMFGGPGWLVVYPGNIAVIHQHGQIERAVGSGPEFLKRAEKIKAILPLGKKADSKEIKNVLTRDRIPLTVNIFHVAQLESAAETKTRLKKERDETKARYDRIKNDTNVPDEEKTAAKEAAETAQHRLTDLEKGPTIKDDFDICYESVAKIAAAKAADIWKAFEGSIASNLKDVMMTVYAEELFSIDKNNGEIEDKINKRKIAEIEQTLMNKLKDSKMGDGVKLRFLDIGQIQFPDELQAKINEEVEIQIEERIQKTRARIEESKAKGSLVAARAKAQARILEGQGEGEAQAALFREILRELKRENVLRDDEIATALLQLISSNVSVKELQSFFKATATSRRMQNMPPPDEPNGNHQEDLF